MNLLQEVLPIGNTINAATVRNKVYNVGRRIDEQLGKEQVFFIDGCERDWERLPRPDLPLTVGIDGGYVHNNTRIILAPILIFIKRGPLARGCDCGSLALTEEKDQHSFTNTSTSRCPCRAKWLSAKQPLSYI